MNEELKALFDFNDPGLKGKFELIQHDINGFIERKRKKTKRQKGMVKQIMKDGNFFLYLLLKC